MPGEDEGALEGATDIEIARVSENGFVMRVPAHIEVKAFVNINFAMCDSIEKDYVPMGSQSIETDIDFHAHILIDCSVDGEQYEITGAQLVGGPSSIDIGYIDFSLTDDDYHYDE